VNNSSCKRLSTFFIFFFLLCRAHEMAASVVEGPITNVLNGHVYYILAPESWSNAQTEAHSLGGHLTTIRSSGENNWLLTNLVVDFSASGGPNLFALPVWIGLYDPTFNDGSQHAADFIWDSGETNAYRNWNPGEPSNTGNVEYYTAMNWHYAQGATSTRGTWNDAPLDGSSGYGGNTDGPYYGIMEIGTGVPAIPTVPGAFYGPVVSSINNHPYFILPLNNWSNAQQAAQALGGNLATVRSDEENQWLVANMLADLTFYGGPNLSTLPLWIGLYDPVMGAETSMQHSNNFVWISGETAAYRNWNSSTGEPNNTGGNEYYTAINWHFAQGETNVHTTWDDTPLNGTSGFGGNSDGPYYGIAEVDTNALSLLIGLTNSILTLTPVPNVPGVVLQSTTNLTPPVIWAPIWTNAGNAPYTNALGSGNSFFRLAN
jgi:hypothetical protein